LAAGEPLLLLFTGYFADENLSDAKWKEIEGSPKESR
jgi:hypothetical protein